MKTGANINSSFQGVNVFFFSQEFLNVLDGSTVSMILYLDSTWDHVDYSTRIYIEYFNQTLNLL